MLGSFPIDPKTGQPLQPSPRPIDPQNETYSIIAHRFNSLEDAHRVLAGNPLASLPPLPEQPKVSVVEEKAKKTEK